jgi:hypothetical protein
MDQGYGIEPFLVVVEEEELAHLEANSDSSHYIHHGPCDFCFLRIDE